MDSHSRQSRSATRGRRVELGLLLVIEVGRVSVGCDGLSQEKRNLRLFVTEEEIIDRV